MKPSLVYSLLLLFFLPAPSNRLVASVKIRPSQEDALLALKSAYSGFAGSTSWAKGADCSKWAGVTCGPVGNVLRLSLNSSGIKTPVAGIHSSLSGLSHLQTLNLANNALLGPLTTTLSKLTRLQHLDLSSNLFNKNPNYIWGLTQLTYLDISKTLVSGPLSPSIGALTNLEVLNVSNTYLAGAIPDEFSSLVKLRFAHFDKCFFTDLPAMFPEFDSSASNLTFSASVNLLADMPITFPASGSGVASMDLAGNRIASLPTEIVLMSDLTSLNLAGNGIVGQMSDYDWPILENIVGLFFGRNLLEGKVPVSISTLTKLKYFHFGANALKGSLPEELGNLSELLSLDLSSNADLGGYFPVSINDLPNLTRLVLSGDSFTGPLPQPFLGAVSSFVLDVRNNSFSGSPIIQGVCPADYPTRLKVELNCLDVLPDCETTQAQCS
ncbi:hypothetical protein CLOM_g15388 [Closterium sp. NIES-68]|nr:hypothetical protein CLOM_g15388 [Closterium sp. NIES-68]GJP65685.1 hypothetical protein CLOP_g22551 [Closterium sp. NIES-67]